MVASRRAQYVSNIRCSSVRLRVRVSPSMSRMRAFCGVRLSAVTLPRAWDAPNAGDPPAPDSRAVGHGDTRSCRLVQRIELGRRHEARRESRCDDPLRARTDTCFDRGAVRARVGVDDVDPGQGIETAHVEFGIRSVPAQRRPVERHAVGVRVPQRTEVRAAAHL